MRRYSASIAIVLIAAAAAGAIGWRLSAERARMEFVHTGDASSTRALISSGRDINEAGPLGSTALMQAARGGQPDAVKAILGQKPRVDAEDQSGRTAVNWSLYMYKMSKDANYSLITRMLLDSGASVAHRDRQGRTYLMHALDAGDFEAAKALVSRGIDVNAADQSGTTALMCVMKGALTGAQIASMCEMLLAKGANPGVRNVSKMTAYEMAASQKDRETREAGVKALGRVKGR